MYVPRWPSNRPVWAGLYTHTHPQSLTHTKKVCQSRTSNNAKAFVVGHIYLAKDDNENGWFNYANFIYLAKADNENGWFNYANASTSRKR